MKVDVVPKEYVAESVVRSLRRRVKGKRVLLVRAKVARDVIPQNCARPERTWMWWKPTKQLCRSLRAAVAESAEESADGSACGDVHQFLDGAQLCGSAGLRGTARGP